MICRGFRCDGYRQGVGLQACKTGGGPVSTFAIRLCITFVEVAISPSRSELGLVQTRSVAAPEKSSRISRFLQGRAVSHGR